ncbi:hypothetical protein ACSVH2_07395 [Flavobacterium sp. RSB2_4_14]|uniref:hypothetical protein n=1 Tax=Flavobacterium sp. RSB2_4_14 TaxID=3447665 RepID=UPI003F3FE721
MKRIVSAILLLFIITACDDGDLKVDVIDFSDVPAQKCSDKYIVYKTKEAEMLILSVPEEVYVQLFKNDETLPDTPRVVEINSSNQVIYRQYNGTVSADNICPNVTAATPNVIEEWNATSGTIEITTTSIKTVDANNATRITGYKHNIVFKNITFQKPSGNQTYETYVFGDYTTSVSALAFGFDEEVDKSTCDNRIFDFAGGEAFILDVADYATLFENAVTTDPRTATISATNKLSYRLYSNTISNTYFCTTPQPTTPALLQQWNAVDGVTDVSGIIEVTTTVYGTGFQHTIHLKKVTLKKDNSTFSLGDDYLFGSFITNP